MNLDKMNWELNVDREKEGSKGGPGALGGEEVKTREMIISSIENVV